MDKNFWVGFPKYGEKRYHNCHQPADSDNAEEVGFHGETVLKWITDGHESVKSDGHVVSHTREKYNRYEVAIYWRGGHG